MLRLFVCYRMVVFVGFLICFPCVGSADEWALLYMNQPRDGSRPDGGLRQKFAAFVDAAEQTIDMSAYDIEEPVVAESLIRAKRRGVRVRVVTDDHYVRGNGVLNGMVHAGIPYITEKFDGGSDDDEEVHNKFLVMDGQYVWTGSLNLTPRGFDKHEENVIILENTSIAAQYTAEFEEMWGGSGPEPDKSHAALGKEKQPNTEVDHTFLGSPLKLYFTPERGRSAEAALVEEIAKARQEIFLVQFMFTSQPVLNALLDAHDRGIKIRGIFEATNAGNQYSGFTRLRSVVGSVRTERSIGGGIVHHKLMIIDPMGPTPCLMIGSYNMTKKAQANNDENFLLIHDPQVVQDAMTEVLIRWGI